VSGGLRARVRTDGITALAACFALGALIEDLANPTVVLGGHTYDRGPEAVIAVALVAMVVLVGLRRRFGFVAPLAAVACTGLAALPARAWVVDSSAFFLLAMLVCGITGYLAVTGWTKVASLAVIWSVAAIAEWRHPTHSWSGLFFIAIFMTTAWVVGLLVRRPVVQARTAQDRAAQLEAEQALAAERAAQEERRRIARELHDIIAHSVSVMTVQAGAVRRLLHPDQSREQAALVSIEKSGRDALAEMRRLVGLLKDDSTPSSLAPQPGLASLDELVVKVSEAGLPVHVTVEGEAHPLTPGADLTAFRVVQEALTNAIKYAGPARACVTLSWAPRELVIEVTNDGTSTQHNSVGFGQVGMRERLALYGGRLESGPGRDGGYQVRAHLPFEAE
jgi:signal transduction histidine kinase